MSRRAQWRLWQRAYIERLRSRVRELLGEACRDCGELQGLELAHVGKTRLHGRGRGSGRRLRDALANPESYVLLCRPCHMELDFMGRDRWNPTPDPRQRMLEDLEAVPF